MCVGLMGLNDNEICKLKYWNCPVCFRFIPAIQNKLPKPKVNVTSVQNNSISQCNTIKVMLKEELNLITDVLRCSVKYAVVNAMGAENKNVVDAVSIKDS